MNLRLPFLIVAAMLLGTVPVFGHEGPPFPVVSDRAIGPWIVSIWTDPDIGTGTFFVVLEPRSDGRMVPADGVSLYVSPIDGHRAPGIYPAQPQEVQYGARYFAEVPFDRGGRWEVRVTIARGRDSWTIPTSVTPTPDGLPGVWIVGLYAFPFLLVGFLWVRILIAKRRSERSGTEAQIR